MNLNFPLKSALVVLALCGATLADSGPRSKLPVLYRVDQPTSNVVVFRGADVARAKAAGLLPAHRSNGDGNGDGKGSGYGNGYGNRYSQPEPTTYAPPPTTTEYTTTTTTTTQATTTTTEAYKAPETEAPKVYYKPGPASYRPVKTVYYKPAPAYPSPSQYKPVYNPAPKYSPKPSYSSYKEPSYPSVTFYTNNTL